MIISTRRLDIAREIMKGRHGFSYLSQCRIEIDAVLDKVVTSTHPVLVMITGSSGVGVTTILEDFEQRHRGKTITVNCMIGELSLTLPAHIARSIFPIKEHNDIESKIVGYISRYTRLTSRNIVLIDDLEVIADLNNFGSNIINKVKELSAGQCGLSFVMSTRRASLLRHYAKLKAVSDIEMVVSGDIKGSKINSVVGLFFKACNDKYDTQVVWDGFPLDALSKASLDICQVIYMAETIYCLALLGGSARDILKSTVSKIDLSSFASWYELRNRVGHEFFPK